MEKDSNKKDSDSEDPLNDNEFLQSIVDLGGNLVLQKQNLQKKIENMKKKMELNQTLIEYYKDTLSQTGISEFQSLNLESHISSTASPIYEYQNLSEDAFPSLHDSAVLSGSLETAEAICQESVETFDSFDSSIEEKNRPSARAPKSLSHCLNILESMCVTFDEKVLLNNPPPQASSPGNETQETCIDTRLDTSFENQSLGEFLKDAAETDAISGRNSVGKGKESANPKFRYKKRSKPDVSSCESITKYSKEAFGISDSKAVKSQSPKNKFTKISLSLKRKGSCDSSEQSSNKRQLNEGCGRTIPFSTSSGNREDHVNLKVEKKLKFEDHENASRQYPSLTSLPSERDPEKLCSNPCKLIGNSQRENEWLCLPSSSRSTSTVHQFTSEEASSTDGSEDM